MVQSANTIVLIFYVWSGTGPHDTRYILFLPRFAAFAAAVILAYGADAGFVTAQNSFFPIAGIFIYL